VLPVWKSILNRCIRTACRSNGRSIPIEGARLPCKYCYARYTHEYMELERIGVRKKDLREEGGRRCWRGTWRTIFVLVGKPSGGARPDHIAIGTATIRISRRSRVRMTRSCLEELAKREWA